MRVVCIALVLLCSLGAGADVIPEGAVTTFSHKWPVQIGSKFAGDIYAFIERTVELDFLADSVLPHYQQHRGIRSHAKSGAKNWTVAVVDSLLANQPGIDLLNDLNMDIDHSWANIHVVVSRIVARARGADQTLLFRELDKWYSRCVVLTSVASVVHMMSKAVSNPQ